MPITGNPEIELISPAQIDQGKIDTAVEVDAFKELEESSEINPKDVSLMFDTSKIEQDQGDAAASKKASA